jgi:hypothetical protein|tara:strand:+ start:2759 stop:3046 length:288 start_codon:yes stop_codon:yes gene_type:complete
MTTIVLIGIDPFAQPGVDFIDKFDSLDSCYVYVMEWINNELERQKNFVCGLKGDKNKHIENYMSFLKENNYLHFYGEFTTVSSEPYEYKWLIYEL